MDIHKVANYGNYGGAGAIVQILRAYGLQSKLPAPRKTDFQSNPEKFYVANSGDVRRCVCARKF